MSDAEERGSGGANALPESALPESDQFGGRGRETLWLMASVATVLVFVCSLFTFIASLALLVFFLNRTGAGPGSPFILKLLAKTVFFGFLSVLGVFGLIRLTRGFPQGDWHSHDSAACEGPQSKAVPVALLIGVLCFAGVLLFPNLDEYPRAEPDETHHLVVARNLAEYGLYASGHPDAGFNVLDDYDSVGPPVILPVAAGLKALGTGIVPARIVMALFFLGLCSAAFLLLYRPFGAGAAALGALMMVVAPHSVYLGRTLYGEVPALLFLIAGLCCWRAALQSKGPGMGFLAGLLFGASVLSKAFMLNSAWAFLGALLYDRMTFRRIGWRHLLAPAVGALTLMGIWWAIQKGFQEGGADIAVNTLAVYRQKLMFGFTPLPRTLGWLFRPPFTLRLGVSILAVGVSIASLAYAVPLVFRRRYDPATVVLFLFVPFVVYWYVFFTTGVHVRYAWYAWGGAGLFAGLFAWGLIKSLASKPTGRLKLAAILLLCTIAIPAIARTQLQAAWVFSGDQMQGERELAAYLEGLPDDVSVATTAWPLERSMNFLAGRNIHRFNRVTENPNDYDVVILDTKAYDASGETAKPGGPGWSRRSFGRYVVYERKAP